MTTTAPDVRLLQAANATSSFDRFVVGPVLLTLAADLGVGLDDAAAVASVYFLCYGLSQPLWGLCSDRLGRVRTLRLTLGAAAVFGAASALAPTLPLLVLARALTGACVAAAVPTSLVYVGDAVPFALRQRTLTDLNAATALGITTATGLGGVLAATVSWRVAFLVPALMAAVLVVLLPRLPEPPRHASAAGRVRDVVRARWGRVVLALALVEGAAMLGLLTYFAPALESAGTSPGRAGALVALFGVGLLLSSRVVKRRAGRTPAPVFLAVGAAGLAGAYALAASSRAEPVIACAALLLGAAWASMHSTMQTWATEAVPQARAATVSLFAGALFVGSGVATAALAGLAAGERWLLLFGVGVVLAAVFGVGAVAARGRVRPRSAARRAGTDVSALLDLSAVTVVRDGAVLLDAVDLQVAAGERWALLGPNGAGKTTLLSVAGAVRHPTSGTAQVLGRPLGRVDVRDLWPLVGHVAGRHRAGGAADRAAGRADRRHRHDRAADERPARRRRRPAARPRRRRGAGRPALGHAQQRRAAAHPAGPRPRARPAAAAARRARRRPRPAGARAAGGRARPAGGVGTGPGERAGHAPPRGAAGEHHARAAAAGRPHGRRAARSGRC